MINNLKRQQTNSHVDRHKFTKKVRQTDKIIAKSDKKSETDRLNYQLTDQLAYWLADCLTDRPIYTKDLTYWLCDRLTHSLTDCRNAPSSNWLTQRLADWVTHRRTKWLAGWLTDQLINRLTDWLIDERVHNWTGRGHEWREDRWMKQLLPYPTNWHPNDISRLGSLLRSKNWSQLKSMLICTVSLWHMTCASHLNIYFTSFRLMFTPQCVVNSISLCDGCV